MHSLLSPQRHEAVASKLHVRRGGKGPHACCGDYRVLPLAVSATGSDWWPPARPQKGAAEVLTQERLADQVVQGREVATHGGGNLHHLQYDWVMEHKKGVYYRGRHSGSTHKGA